MFHHLSNEALGDALEAHAEILSAVERPELHRAIDEAVARLRGDCPTVHLMPAHVVAPSEPAVDLSGFTEAELAAEDSVMPDVDTLAASIAAADAADNELYHADEAAAVEGADAAASATHDTYDENMHNEPSA